VDQPELPIYSFSGSREFKDRRLVLDVLRGLLKRHGPRMRVRVGDATRGLDRLVFEEARRLGIAPWVETCYWPPKGATKYEKWQAAHERNERVVVGSPRFPGRAHALWAFFAPGPRSPGTSDAVKIALGEGVPAKVYHSGRWTES
jgi:hypothetical protein